MSIFFHSFILGSKNKNKFGEINILDCNFLSSSYGNESHKGVGYVMVIPWVVRLYVEIILRTGGQTWYNYFVTSTSV